MNGGDKLSFCKNIQIGEKEVSEASGTFIIAEAGVNHNGNMDVARELIDAAYEAGADAIKFQNFHTDKLILSDVDKAPYQKERLGNTGSQYDMLKTLELQDGQTQMLKEYCTKKGIIFLSTPFEKDSLDFLCDLNVAAIKVAATDATNIHFLRQVASKGKPIILSAGMCYLEEIKKALQAIHSINKQVILLQCTANYPIEDGEVNLNVINTFREEFDVLIGYSDHSKGIGAAPYAVAMGAKLIEKHFTLDKNMAGPDQQASVTPKELCELVKQVRKVEEYLGSSLKYPTFSEQNTRRSLQKCLVASSPIKAGERFTENNIVAKRTNGVGISALYFDNVIGMVSRREYSENDIIES